MWQYPRKMSNENSSVSYLLTFTITRILINESIARFQISQKSEKKATYNQNAKNKVALAFGLVKFIVYKLH